MTTAADALPDLLARLLPSQRWFGGKARDIGAVEVADAIPLGAFEVVLAGVTFEDGGRELYLVPLARTDEGQTVWEASGDAMFQRTLLQAIAEGWEVPGREGVLSSIAVSDLSGAPGSPDLRPRLLQGEQSHTSVAYGDRLILKLFRRLEPGANPELEVGLFLTRRGFPSTPRTAGYLEYRPRAGEAATVAILQVLVRDARVAWDVMLEALEAYFDRVRAGLSIQPTLDTASDDARLLGRRTGELHLTLASTPDDPAFRPEPESEDDHRALYASMERLVEDVFALLQQRLTALPLAEAEKARSVLGRRREILERIRVALSTPLGMRIRIHGDYHLGQILRTPTGFVIIDFEGEPARPLAERREKGWALRDVAGMLRSFDYASQTALARTARLSADPTRPDGLAEAARMWSHAVGVAFILGYYDAVGEAFFLPRELEDRGGPLGAFLLEKAVYEIGYEMNNRPDWVWIPLRGLVEALG